MLCPETNDFAAPKYRFSSEKVTCDGKNGEPKNEFWFNHSITVILPDTLQTPAQLKSCLSEEYEYYKVLNLRASDLLQHEFKENFIKKGTLSALSVGGRIDTDDCLCVTPNGLLTLSLTKFTYESLGIPGKPSRFYRNAYKYVVHIDLCKPYLRPGKNGYNKLMQRLRDFLPTFNVIIRWEPPTDATCPSSVAAYLTERHYEVQLCIIDVHERTAFSITVPASDFNSKDVNDAQLFVEWLGMVNLQCDLTTMVLDFDNAITTYQVPEPNQTIGQIRIVQFRGFFTPLQVSQALDCTKKYVTPSTKWAAMYVQGFSDTPISSGTLEHHYHTSGDYSYTYLLNPGSYLLCKHVPSYKKHK